MDFNVIKSIETIYNGYRFRSRLEARWAVFFDAAGISYEYEPEGIEVDGTHYLPDFYLPQFDLYAEVKRNTPEGLQEIIAKCEPAVTWGSPIKQILILSDVPGDVPNPPGMWHFPIIYYRGDHTTWGWWFFHGNYGEIDGNISAAGYWSARNWIREHGITAVNDWDLRPPVLQDLNDPPEGMTVEQWRAFKREWEIVCNGGVFDALVKARQARFEHGETPAAK